MEGNFNVIQTKPSTQVLSNHSQFQEQDNLRFI